MRLHCAHSHHGALHTNIIYSLLMHHRRSKLPLCCDMRIICAYPQTGLRVVIRTIAGADIIALGLHGVKWGGKCALLAVSELNE